MPGTDPTTGLELDQKTVEFLGREAERLGTTPDAVLRRLVEHYRTAREDGLSCPHCNNDLLIEV